MRSLLLAHRQIQYVAVSSTDQIYISHGECDSVWIGVISFNDTACAIKFAPGVHKSIGP